MTREVSLPETSISDSMMIKSDLYKNRWGHETLMRSLINP